MASAADIKDELFAAAIPGKREVLSSFFKTGEGQYGEGDLFIGVTVPQQRAIVKQFAPLSLDEISILLASEFHECRMTGLLFLVDLFKKNKKNESVQKEVFDFYLSYTHAINNWDLVDLSAPQIVGDYLLSRDRSVLHKLSESANMWERRIAIVSTYTFIKKGDFTDTFKICDTLISDKEDLLNKATGWMLREVGKQDFDAEFAYLKKRYKKMSRTSLRYAIEKFEPEMRSDFLKGLI